MASSELRSEGGGRVGTLASDSQRATRLRVEWPLVGFTTSCSELDTYVVVSHILHGVATNVGTPFSAQ